MTSSYNALNQRPYNPKSTSTSSSSPQPSRRQSKITVEYHRPSRESIAEYNDLLNDSNRQAAAAATAANYTSPYFPARQAPPPPTTVSTNSPASPFKPKSPIDSNNSHHRVRNSLQKPNPASRTRKGSLPSTPLAPRADIITDPFAAAQSDSNGMTSPPPRPSRANTATLNDIYTGDSPLAARRLSSPNVAAPDAAFYADPSESMPAAPSQEYNSISSLNSGPRSRNSAKSKRGGMLGFMSDFLSQSKRIEISTPYDPVHLTHVGFNSSTGEFTGLPKEWQQLLQESGISRQDQEKNPQAVMEIVKFYQEGVHGDVWDKMNAVDSPTKESPEQNGFGSPVSPPPLPAVRATDTTP